MPHYPTVPFDHWDRAQEMRRNPTHAEKMLWRALRTIQLGVTFRRQHPIGPYIVDFVCIAANLIVELDGDTHAQPEQIEYDRQRDDYLKARGFRVRRYHNLEVLRNLNGVLQDIEAALKK
jgi:very-short-patch-repair endonuclease